MVCSLSRTAVGLPRTLRGQGGVTRAGPGPAPGPEPGPEPGPGPGPGPGHGQGQGQAAPGQQGQDRQGQGQGQGQGHGQGQGQRPGPGKWKKDSCQGFRVIQYTVTVLGDQAWRPLRGAVGRLCSSSKACHGLAERSTAPAYPTEVRGVAGGFRVWGFGFRV